MLSIFIELSIKTLLFFPQWYAEGKKSHFITKDGKGWDGKVDYVVLWCLGTSRSVPRKYIKSKDLPLSKSLATLDPCFFEKANQQLTSAYLNCRR